MVLPPIGGGSDSLGDIRATFTLDPSGVRKGIASAHGSLKQGLDGIDRTLAGSVARTGRRMQAIGRSGALLIAPFAALGTIGLKAAADFEEATAAISARAELTAAELEKVRQTAKDLGRDTVFSAQQAADAMLQLVTAGQTVDQALGMLPHILNLTAAAGGDLGTTADQVTNIMSIFRLEIEDTARVVDSLAAAAASSPADVNMLAQALEAGGGVARNLGIEIEQTSAILAIFARNGIKGSEAGTSLRSMLLAMTRPIPRVTASWEKLGTSLFDAEGNARDLNTVLAEMKVGLEGLPAEEVSTVLRSLGGTYGITALNALLASDGINAMVDTMDGQRKASEIAAERMNTFNQVINSLKGSVETLLITALTPFMQDVLKPMAKELIRVTNAVTNWVAENKGLATAGAIAVLALTALFGALLSIGTVMTLVAPGIAAAAGAFGALGIGISASLLPIALVVGAVGLLAAAFLTDFAGIRTTVEGVVQGVIPLLRGLADSVLTVLGGIVEGLTRFVSFAAGIVGSLARAFGLAEFGDALDSMADKAAEFGENVNASLQDAIPDDIEVTVDADVEVAVAATVEAEKTPAQIEEEVVAGVPATMDAAGELNIDVQQVIGYTVKGGDTLSGIAARYGLSVDDILALNPHLTLEGNRWLYAGETIYLPLGARVSITDIDAPDSDDVNTVVALALENMAAAGGGEYDRDTMTFTTADGTSIEVAAFIKGLRIESWATASGDVETALMALAAGDDALTWDSSARGVALEDGSLLLTVNGVLAALAMDQTWMAMHSSVDRLLWRVAQATPGIEYRGGKLVDAESGEVLVNLAAHLEAVNYGDWSGLGEQMHLMFAAVAAADGPGGLEWDSGSGKLTLDGEVVADLNLLMGSWAGDQSWLELYATMSDQLAAGLPDGFTFDAASGVVTRDEDQAVVIDLYGLIGSVTGADYPGKGEVMQAIADASGGLLEWRDPDMILVETGAILATVNPTLVTGTAEAALTQDALMQALADASGGQLIWENGQLRVAGTNEILYQASAVMGVGLPVDEDLLERLAAASGGKLVVTPSGALKVEGSPDILYQFLAGVDMTADADFFAALAAGSGGQLVWSDNQLVVLETGQVVYTLAPDISLTSVLDEDMLTKLAAVNPELEYRDGVLYSATTGDVIYNLNPQTIVETLADADFLEALATASGGALKYQSGQLFVVKEGDTLWTLQSNIDLRAPVDANYFRVLADSSGGILLFDEGSGTLTLAETGAIIYKLRSSMEVGELVDVNLFRQLAAASGGALTLAESGLGLQVADTGELLFDLEASPLLGLPVDANFYQLLADFSNGQLEWDGTTLAVADTGQMLYHVEGEVALNMAAAEPLLAQLAEASGGALVWDGTNLTTPEGELVFNFDTIADLGYPDGGIDFYRMLVERSGGMLSMTSAGTVYITGTRQVLFSFEGEATITDSRIDNESLAAQLAASSDGALVWDGTSLATRGGELVVDLTPNPDVKLPEGTDFLRLLAAHNPGVLEWDGANLALVETGTILATLLPDIELDAVAEDAGPTLGERIQNWVSDNLGLENFTLTTSIFDILTGKLGEVDTAATSMTSNVSRRMSVMGATLTRTIAAIKGGDQGVATQLGTRGAGQGATLAALARSISNLANVAEETVERLGGEDEGILSALLAGFRTVFDKIAGILQKAIDLIGGIIEALRGAAVTAAEFLTGSSGGVYEGGSPPQQAVGGGANNSRRDQGGIGLPGRAYLIGQKAQPELFYPRERGEFVPLQKLLEGGGGESLTLNIYPQINPDAGPLDSQISTLSRAILDEIDRR